MRIVIISDTHEYHPTLRLPEGDCLIHCGDYTHIGNIEPTKRFLDWLGRQDFKHKILINGNHEVKAFQQSIQIDDLLPDRVTYLEDNLAIIEGYKFYGSPWTPKFFDWAYQYDRSRSHEQWASLPSNIDVLITHGPPLGILDTTRSGAHVGCEGLAERVKVIKPKLHCFGHIHSGYGRVDGEVTYVNAAICDESYAPLQKPQVFDLPRVNKPIGERTLVEGT